MPGSIPGSPTIQFLDSSERQGDSREVLWAVKLASQSKTPDPSISLIVTIVDGGEVLDRFLSSVEAVDCRDTLEVIVPFDDSIPNMEPIKSAHPGFTYLDLGSVATTRPKDSQAGQHELFDRRRAAGLALARADIIAILEDRGCPTPDWASTATRLHRELGHAVIGGAIDLRPGAGLLNQALHVTDFGRYARPFDAGPREWVSDVNITYSRKALEETRPLWQDRYHEPKVHWHLLQQGETLFLSDQLRVLHERPGLKLRSLLSERFHWGRLFGRIRAEHQGIAKRLAFICGAPLVPPILWLRHGLRETRKGRGLAYLVALPLVALLTIAWALGEAVGAATLRD